MEWTLFRTPPQEYGLCAFWFWNDDIQPQEAVRQLEEMAAKGIREAVIHARVGLITPYLSEAWFDAIQATAQAAERLGMWLWLYDEDNFPSGYAGGLVLQENSDYCGKHLKRIDDPQAIRRFFAQESPDRFVMLFDPQTGSTLTDYPAAAQAEAAGMVLFAWDYTRWQVAFDDSLYIDVLSPEACACFMRHTHEKYAARFGRYFGTVIRGFFSDEAGMYQNLKCFRGALGDGSDYDTIAWTRGFGDYFYRRNGYALEPHLELLWNGDSAFAAQVRNDYYQTISDRYREAFLLPQQDFCHQHGVKLIGHLHMEDYLRYHIITQGDFFAALDTFDFAGVDRIEYSSQKLTEKLASSVAHVGGKPFTLSESFACAGWDMTMTEVRRWTDFQYVRGINKLSMHAFFYSTRDERKWDCAPSYFEGNPYWEDFDLYAAYISRLGYALSDGSPAAEVALYYPMETAYRDFRPQDHQVVDALQQFVDRVGFCLLEHQEDYDFVTGTTLLKAEAADGVCGMGDGRYRYILLPGCDCLPLPVMRKLLELAEAGVGVLFLRDFPRQCVRPSDQPAFEEIAAALAGHPNVRYIDENHVFTQYTFAVNFAAIAEFLYRDTPKNVQLTELQGYSPIEDEHIRVLHRRLENGELYFVVNEHRRPFSGEIRLHCCGAVRRPDAQTGKVYAVDSVYQDGYTCIPLTLSGYDSVLLLVDRSETAVALSESSPRGTHTLELSGPWEIEADGKSFCGELMPISAYGLSHFSGTITYRKRFWLPAPAEHLTLELSGRFAGVRATLNAGETARCLWAPFTLSFSAPLEAGENEIVLCVHNTLYNRFHDADRPAGLCSPPVLRYDT